MCSGGVYFKYKWALPKKVASAAVSPHLNRKSNQPLLKKLKKSF